jgi:hypothetical protein
LSVEIKITGPIERLPQPQGGLAVRAPLNNSPDASWRELFANHGELEQYFARIQFGDRELELLFGDRAQVGDVKAALDSVQRAIDGANTEQAAAAERAERAQADVAKVDRDLQEWSAKHVLSR